MRKFMVVLSTVVLVIGLSVACEFVSAAEQDETTAGTTSKEPQKVCPMDTTLMQQGIKENMAKMCPLCDMMNESPSPAAWILNKHDMLQLTDAQRKHLQAMDTKFREKQADREAEAAKKRAEINKVLAKDTTSPNALQSALKGSSYANIKGVISWMKAKDAAMKELTGEQRGKLMITVCSKECTPQETPKKGDLILPKPE